MTEPEPMSREELIKYVKEFGIQIQEWKDGLDDSLLTSLIGWAVYNESKAKVYVALLSGHLLIYVEAQS